MYIYIYIYSKKFIILMAVSYEKAKANLCFAEPQSSGMKNFKIAFSYKGIV